MAGGLGILRLPPDAFWRMTPREFASAIEGLSGGQASAIGHDELGDLMRRFPDAR
jgi:uncharacterized phage protein (TIGR02216 family)